MIRFKQFLVERSIENQLAWVRQAEQALKNIPTQSTRTSTTYGIPSGGYNITFDSFERKEHPFMKGPNQGYYDAPTKEIKMIDSNADLRRAQQTGSRQSSVLAHEVGHRYQHVAQGDSVPFLRARVPQYNFRDSRLNRKMGYMHSDVEINSRALEYARRAQTSYLENLIAGFDSAKQAGERIDDPTVVQGIKNFIRDKTLKQNIFNERWIKPNLKHEITGELNSQRLQYGEPIPAYKPSEMADTWKRFDDSNSKIDKKIKTKIARAMFEVDPDFSKPGSVEEFLKNTKYDDKPEHGLFRDHVKDMGEYSREVLKNKQPTQPTRSPRIYPQEITPSYSSDTIGEWAKMSDADFNSHLEKNINLRKDGRNVLDLRSAAKKQISSITLPPVSNEPSVVSSKKPGILTKPLPGSNSPALSTAAKIGAGVVGGLVGEYVVKPAAEKAGVFKAIESGTRAALSNTPDWVAKAADPVLGAARLALDPIGTTSEFLEKQARMSLPTTKAERDRATERFERKDY